MNWLLESILKKIKRRFLNCFNILSSGQNEYLDLISGYFDEIERFPVRFSEGVRQMINFDEVLLKAEEFGRTLKVSHSQDQIELERRIIALRYRLESVNGGINPEKMDSKTLGRLLRHAEEWGRDKVFISDDGLNEFQIQQLVEASKYPNFTKLLIRGRSLRDRFFEWAIQDSNDVAIFIQFPALQERLVESNLSSRIGYYKCEHLQVKKELENEVLEKIVTLKIDGKDVNSLDTDEKVEIRGNMQMNVGEVLSAFRRKTEEIGDLEFMKDGVINWNVHEWGWKDVEKDRLVKVNFEAERYWEQLPVFQVIGLNEAQTRYGEFLNGENWAVAARATRSSRDLNTLGCHAFMDILIPVRGGDSYQIFPLGKYATGIPLAVTGLEGLPYFCMMAKATVAYLDENVFYSHREHATQTFELSKKQGKALMEIIRHTMIESINGHFLYQIESENCAKWVQETLHELLGEDKVPNLFRMSFLDVDLEGVPGALIRFARLFPKSWQAWVLTRMHIPLGANRGVWIEKSGQRYFVSLATVPFWEDAMIYAPPLLHNQ